MPVGCVAQDGGGDASAARSDEQASVTAISGEGQPAFDEGADLRDQWHHAGALALGALVDQATHYDKPGSARITVRATAWTDRGEDGTVIAVRPYQDLSPLYGGPEGAW